MKESHLFYAPQLSQTLQLPEEEAAHAVRVLRRKEGDDLWITDGAGHFFDCTVSAVGTGRHPQCFVTIENEYAWQQHWVSDIHLAAAPTKNTDRLEWLAEKATEIGFNGLHFLDCANSERRVLKTERVEKIVVSAAKQSHKGHFPQISTLEKFKTFIAKPFEGNKYIAHCYAQTDIDGTTEKPFLYDVVEKGKPSLVLIGPEGDFSVEEVRLAASYGFQSISLGESRLRTETAALVAVQLMNLKQSH